MTELYLIAHKVRGEPAFDIATCEEVEGEDMWIIPTSGHRAHPYHHPEAGYAAVPLSELEDRPTGWLVTGEWIEWIKKVMTDEVPDHYPTAAEPRNAPSAGHGLLARLGLLRKTTIKRRV